MAQRGCDACPDIDNTPRHEIIRPDGVAAYYHLGCRPITVNDTTDLHPRCAQLVHSHEQAVGADVDGHDLGAVGQMVSRGTPFTVAEMTINNTPIGEVSAELYAADDTPAPTA